MTAAGLRLTIDTLAQQVLTAVENQFTASALELPVRRYIAAGDPLSIAWDCEQLVVALQGIGWGQAEDLSVATPKVASQFAVSAVRHAVFSIQLIRCNPSVGKNGLPSPDDVHAAGLQAMRDAGQLSQALVWLVSHLELGPDGIAQAGAITPQGPSGGYHGMEGTLSITAGELA